MSIVLSLSIFCHAQTISKLTITDNLSASSKFTVGKPKPAAAKDQFELIEDKGTQVLFYTDLNPDESLPETYTLLFTAYLLKGGSEVWVDERLLNVKRTASFAKTAVYFFDPGQYKIVVTKDSNKEVILAKGDFTILKT